MSTGGLPSGAEILLRLEIDIGTASYETPSSESTLLSLTSNFALSSMFI